MENKKMINEMASDMDYGCVKHDLWPEDAKEIAKALTILGYQKVGEDEVIISKEEYGRLHSIEIAFEEFAKPDGILISKEEYDCLKKIEKAYDPFWFCSFGGCEGACKECKDTCEMSIFVKERKKFYDKFNENICIFGIKNNNQEYVDGYTQAIADICGRLDETAIELGVNIKE